MSEETKMLPCPFCGGSPEITQQGANQLTMKCQGCKVKFVQKVLRHTIEWLREKMISQWNTRENSA